MAAAGYDYARCLAAVAWAGLEIDPAAPWYWDAIVGVTRAHWDTYGLRTAWDFGDLDTPLLRASVPDLEAFYRRFGERLAPIAHMVQRISVVNEWWNRWDGGGNWRGTPATLTRCAQILRETQDAPVSLSAPQSDTAALMREMSDGAGICPVHLDRTTDTWEREYRPARQARGPQDTHADGVPWADNEPAGPESSGPDYRDPDLILGSRIAAVMCEAVETVYHSRAGTGNKGKRDMAQSPGVREAATVKQLLPCDIGRWRFVNHTSADHPFTIDAVGDQMGTIDGSRDGVVRAFCQVRGERFIAHALGIFRRSRWTARRKCEVSIVAPLNGPTYPPRTLAQGEVLELLEHPNHVITGRYL